jgi:hypothetical protein
VPLEQLSFPLEVEQILSLARRTHKPFWPAFSGFMVTVDVVISIGIIVLGALTVSFSSGRPGVIRGLSITSTILAGLSALLKGTVSILGRVNGE